MSTITHEGQEYILKSHVENMVKDRVAKVAKRANEAESLAKDYQAQIEEQKKAMGTVDLLSQQVTELQGKLSQSEQKYSRYSAISRFGMTDPDMIEAVEWSYDKAMAKLPKKDRSDLNTWLASQVADPASAPIMLRPHLQTLQPAAQAEPAAETASPPAREPATYPQVNAGRRDAPEVQDVITRGLSDPDFYKANRDKIVQAYNNQFKRKGFNP